MAFSDLTGIEKREKKEIISSGLEMLLQAGDAFLNKFSRLSIEEHVDLEMNNHSYAEDFIKEKLRGVEYCAADIVDYVIIKSRENAQERGYLEEEDLARYSGIILSRLTEKNSRKGKKTVIKIDGKNGTFNNLFRGAEFFDEIYISNMNGGWLCSAMANGNILVLNNCSSNGAAAFIGMGMNGGVKTAILNNVTEPSYKLRQAFGSVDKSDKFFNIANLEGHVGLAMINNSANDEVMQSYDIETLHYHSITHYSIAEQLVIRNFPYQKNPFKEWHLKRIGDSANCGLYSESGAVLFSYNISPLPVIDCSQVIIENNFYNLGLYTNHQFGETTDPTAEIQEFLRKNGMDRIIALADEMTEADLDTIQKNARQIYRIHEETATPKMLKGRENYCFSMRRSKENIPDVLEEFSSNIQNGSDSGKIYESAEEKIQKKRDRWIKNAQYDIKKMSFIKWAIDKIRR
ncbi:MAG: hypothetical protein NTV63_04795 [Candidatus Woesearchaeota archaeon]|nr:hypothetical protein [Candidatus Woesearchaeota archaeon]